MFSVETRWNGSIIYYYFDVCFQLMTKESPLTPGVEGISELNEQVNFLG